MKDNIAILILAAGEASRMGRPKQLLPWGGTTLLGQVIQAAQETAIGPVFCVLGAHAEQIQPHIESFDIQILYNGDWHLGLGRSLALGIQQIRKIYPHLPALVVLLGDQPLVRADHLRALVEAHTAQPGKIIASDYPEGPGVPVVFPADLFPHLEDLQGDVGARPLLRRWADQVLTVSAPGKLLDIDTPADYQLWNRGIDLDGGEL